MTTALNGNKIQGFNTYLAVMPSGSGSISQRVNTNFRFVTHIPALKLVFTTTAQVVWYESAQTIYEDENGNSMFEHIKDFKGKEVYMVHPEGFYDGEGKYTVWDKTTMPYNREYLDLINYTTNMYYYDKQTFPMTCMLNFKMTKEFKKFVELSFVANNILKFSNTFYKDKQGGYRELYSPIYFGAELKIKI